MKAPSPLLGFNNNVKHKGRVFHIQTEDSGVKHPHVITHLFVDGGRILKSTKTSYAEFLEQEDLSTRVRQLMQEQHKAMFIALRAGKFDHMMEGGEAPAPASQAGAEAPPAAPPASADGAAPAPRPATAPPRAPSIPPSEAPLSPRAEAAGAGEASPPVSPRAAADKPPAPEPQAAPTPPRRPVTQPPSSGSPVSLRPPSLIPPPPRASSPSLTSERAVASDRGSFTNERGGGPVDRAPTSEPQPTSQRRADPRAPTMATEAARPSEGARARLQSPLELNLEAIERSAADPRPSVAPESDLRDLPPPPAAVLGKKPVTINTSYRSIQHADPRAEPPGPEDRGRAPEPTVSRPPSLTPPSRPKTSPMGLPPQRPGRSVAPPPRSITPQGARYAPSRPASIFGNARPQEGSSIFGEDLISEKSLDEVILSYLAEDLEGSKPKR